MCRIGKRSCVELREHALEWEGGLLVDDELAGVRLPVEAPGLDGEQP